MVSSSQIRGIRSRLVAHGWNIDIDAAGIVPALVQLLFIGGLGTGWFEGGCICTLLGPEGPGHALFGVGGLNLWTFPGFTFWWDAGEVPPVL
ncbi:hypothetical protein GCM10017602_36540 [Herbiconiux flava]|nr:hypothetical protein GCM10017602_36540 [Herbiconiux flava]